MCKDDGFRNSTITCAKDKCAVDGTSDADYESALNTVLDSCANGEFSVPTSASNVNTKTTTSRHQPTSTSTIKDDSGPSTGLIAGAAIGGVVLVALFGVLIWWLVKRSKRRAALENRPAFYPATPGPVTPMGDDSKLGAGQPMTQTNQPGGFAGYNGQPYQQQYNNTTASTNYANSTATGPSAFGAPHAELGYVPPSQFDQFGAGAMGAASFAATTGTSGQQRPQYPAQTSSNGGSSSSAQLLTTATPPSQSGSSGSRPGTSDAGVGGFNPYLVGQQQQQAPLQLHQAQYDPYAAAGGSADKWPADVKRPLTVMSADETPHPQQQGDLPPPMYTRQ